MCYILVSEPHLKVAARQDSVENVRRRALIERGDRLDRAPLSGGPEALSRESTWCESRMSERHESAELRESTRGRSWPRRVVNRFEVDRATFYAVASRGWQLAAGPLTMVIIALWLRAEQQGYYYTFASLLAIQGLVELGLHVVILNVASHEWARLRLEPDGSVTGDAGALGRLAQLVRFVSRTYGGIALLFVLAAGIAGVLLFRSRPEEGVDWMAPWLTLVVVNGGVIWIWSRTAVLEGCNQVAVVHGVRLAQAVTGSIVVWSCILLGAGLWALVASAVARLVWDFWLVFVRHHRFFASVVNADSDENAGLDWRTDIWPLQWRLAMRAVVGYFALNLFTPVIFHYHGAVEAGKMGMTWTALTALEAAAFAWMQTRTARFGMLAAQRDFVEFDRVYRRLTLVSTVVLVCGSVVLCVAVLLLNSIPFAIAEKVADRLLPLGPTVLFCAGLTLFHLPKCQNIYVQAHRKDPLMLPSVIMAGLIALAVWQGGRISATQQAWGYLIAVGALYVPVSTWVWARFRRARNATD